MKETEKKGISLGAIFCTYLVKDCFRREKKKKKEKKEENIQHKEIKKKNLVLPRVKRELCVRT